MKGQLILQDSPIFPSSQKRSSFPAVSIATQSGESGRENFLFE